MAGIYIHIPFCRQQCNYCDFFKTINTNSIKIYFNSLKKEIIIRQTYLNKEVIETIYFGGGTPSILNINELEGILDFLYRNFFIIDNPEITLEANPDDLDFNYLYQLYQVGINRLSIGIQSFFDNHLKNLNRRHNASQAIDSVKNAAKAGFNNINVDLIYGFPGLSLRQWEYNLNKVFQLPVNHLSAYHLTYHEGTAFFNLLNKGILKELPEKESIDQFNSLVDATERGGYEHYEISNFASNQMYSKHNTSYWRGQKYLGLGPSAHSYDGFSRQWNVSNLEEYIGALENNYSFFQREQLSLNDKYNEYILTNIRTKWGVSLPIIEKQFGKERAGYFLNAAEKYLILKKMVKLKDIFFLTREGFFIADDIITGLIII